MIAAELMEPPYPTRAPAVVPPELKLLWRCQFCAQGLHNSCPGAVRNGRKKLVHCYCCVKPPHCLVCGNQETAEVNPETWVCLYPNLCAIRVQQRLENAPLYRQLRECRTESATRARAIRKAAEGIRSGLPADEVDEFDRPQDKKPKAPKRAVAGKCECCGEPTRGGTFLPGHDAKLKSKFRIAAKAGDQKAAAELETRGWK
jgi:hypothetical protein